MHHGQGNKVSGCFPLKYAVVVALLLLLEEPNLVSGSEKQTNKQTSRPKDCQCNLGKPANRNSIQLLKSTLALIEYEAHGQQQAAEINSQ